MRIDNKKRVYLSFIFWLVLIFLGCRDAPDFGPPKPLPFKLITFEDLLTVSSPDPEHVWIGGLNSAILHSSDGGGNWVSQKSPLPTDFMAIFFLDHNNGWAVGKNGAVIHTTDGGNNWIDKTGPVQTNKRLMDVQFVDSQQGWIVGNYGTILHTKDEGTTWEKQGWDEDRIYNHVFFIDHLRGWIVGEYGTILRTKDGGKHWEKQVCQDIIPIVEDIEYSPPVPSLYTVYFQNAERGWAVGLDGVIIFTEDGGQNWRKLKQPIDFSLFKIMVIGDKGWAVGLRGYYVASTDGGESWALQEKAFPTKFWLRGLYFSDQNHGWIVGSKGTIIHTTDGGANWKMLSGISISQGS